MLPNSFNLQVIHMVEFFLLYRTTEKSQLMLLKKYIVLFNNHETKRENNNLEYVCIQNIVHSHFILLM